MACVNGGNGKYIIQVDIPEEELEKGYGRYASINTLFSRYITMDEYRIKKEDFNPEKYLLGIVDVDKIPEEWYATSDKYLEAINSAKEQVYFEINFGGQEIERLDASGLRGEVLSRFIIPEGLKELAEKINQTLYKSIKTYDEIRTREFNPEFPFWESTVESLLRRISEDYTIEQIASLFEGNMSKERIFDVFSIMVLGEICTYDNDYRIVNGSEKSDAKLSVALALAKYDISEKDYSSTRRKILRLCSKWRRLSEVDDKIKKDAIEFVFLEENEFSTPKNENQTDYLVGGIGEFFANCPEDAKKAAKYLFEEEETGKIGDFSKNYEGYNSERVGCYEYVYKNIEKYNSENKENKISFSSIIDLFKELDKIGVKFARHNKKQKEFFQSSQIIELLTQSKENPNYKQNLLNIFEELGAIPEENLTRPKELPYTDRRIAEGVDSINPRDLYSIEMPIKDETKD